MSANSKGDGTLTCSTVEKTGTSMASPSAAGAACLVRQYFSDSKFWSAVCNAAPIAGSPNGCGSFTPSGILVKAALINSGSQMTLFDFGDPTQPQRTVSLGNPPDNVQGYGRITLKNVLPLPVAGYNFGLFVDDLRTISFNSQVVYKANIVDSSAPFQVTLAWYDPANQNGISTPALIHDLDLLVVSPSGGKYYGNGMNTGNNAFDVLNTNERVSVSSPQTGTWTVTVSTKGLFYSNSESYSLVMTMHGYAALGSLPTGPTTPPPSQTPPTRAPTRRSRRPTAKPT